MIFFPTVDEDFQYFRSQGYTGSLNDMHYKALGDLGYTGALSDRIHAFLTFKYGSFYEAMRDLRNGTSVFSLLSSYSVNGLDPALVFDFKGNYFRKSATDSTFGASITHAATTNATMTDGDGLLKWRPHNLLKYSEDLTAEEFVDFGNSGNITVVDSKTLTFAAGYTKFANKSQDVNPNLVGQQITGTVELSSQTHAGEVVKLEMNWRSGSGFDVSHTLTTTPTFVSITGTVPAGATGFDLMVRHDANGTAKTFTATKWHAYRSDLGGMVNNPETGDSYVPTTSTERYLPRVGHHIYNGDDWVNEGLLHESEARTNLLTYSNDFTNSAWSKQNLTATANQATGPDGTVSATEIGITGTAGNSYCINSTASTTGTLSYFAKQNTERFFLIDRGPYGAGDWAIFDLSNGTVSKSPTHNNSTAHITPMGNGWYRCVLQSAQSTAASAFSISGSGTDLSTSTSGTVYLYGVQFEQGATPSSYIPTTGSTATRAAETLTIPSENVPWPETTYVDGTELLSGSWATASGYDNVTSGSDNTLSVTAGTTTPRAYLTITGLTAGDVLDLDFDLGTVSSGAVYMYARSGPSPNAGTVLWSSTDASNTSNVSVDGVVAVDSTAVTIMLTTADTAVDFDATVSVKEINPRALTIQMDGRMTYADTGSNPELTFYQWYISGNDYLRQRLAADGAPTGYTITSQASGGTADHAYSGNNAYSPDVLVPFKIAGRFVDNALQGAADGVVTTENTTPVGLPDLSSTDFSIGYNYMGTIGLFRIWTDDIGESGIVTATSPSTEPSLSLTFDGSETSFTVLDWSE